MKKILIVAFVIIGIIGYFCYFSSQNNAQNNSQYLRIHIRANSNLTQDQDIKYEIKNQLVQALYPIVATSNTKQALENNIQKNKAYLTQIAQDCLHKANLNYKVTISLNSEYFPTRVYNQDVVLKSGVYDALIVELGEAKGDNWWCVIYPPLCFINVNYNGSQKITYKSRIYEIIKNFIN